ncbi:hypothetical protein ABH940_004586 [Streptacidiphilus sp. BW17]|uniref:hypothetical protein n=1 Tax=Streptacidiphilus sp. BW17 TaxID=3156274 RepID=UPI0035110609
MNHRRPNPGELTPDDLFRPEEAHYAEQPTQFQQQGPPSGNGAAATQFLPPAQGGGYGGGYGASNEYRNDYTNDYNTGGGYGGHSGYETNGQGGYGGHGGTNEYDPYNGGNGGYDSHNGYDGYDDGPQRSGPSLRTIAIGVVAACAVAGIGLGAMLSSGSPQAAAQAGGAATMKTANPASIGGATEASQARALSGLLASAANDRSAVIGAVSDIEGCQALPAAQQALSQAAQARGQLVQQLAALNASQLPQGGQLVQALRTGWEASKEADAHYAAWAGQSAGNCQKKHRPHPGGEKNLGDTASVNATQAKDRAASLWNPIASAQGLPTRTTEQL